MLSNWWILYKAVYLVGMSASFNPSSANDSLQRIKTNVLTDGAV